MEQQVQKISWRDIERLAKKVGDEIIDDGLKFDYIVAVGRGGYIPGVILSHHLDLPLKSIMYQTRHDVKYNEEKPEIKADIDNGKSILLVDDINDSGKTFLDLLNEWDYNENSEGDVITATLLQRYNTSAPASIIGRRVNNDRWIQFPWEKE